MSHTILSDTALRVLGRRYLLRNDDGEIVEDPDQMFLRVAKSVARNGTDMDRFLEAMRNLEFLPNSPTLMNAGTDLGMLSACFVIPIPDSITGIMDAAKTQALVQKAGGGTGFSFSRLRPAGDIVKKTHGTSSGPLSFMQVFNATTETIKQGGKRRGANMAVLRCLDGETLINTINGKIKIKDLVGQQPYVYSCDPNTREIHITKAKRIFVSDTNRKMVRVWFDNDDFVDCTPDHRFMLSNGKYKEASSLILGDSLMAFFKSIRKHGKHHRRLIKCSGGKAIFEHRAIARDILGFNVSYELNAHHKNEDYLDNDPSNIEVLTRSDHAKKHNDNLNVAREIESSKRKGKTLEEVYGVDKALAWKEKMAKAKLGKTPWNKNRRISNHRVIKVEEFGVAKEVYDISLAEYHNFSANGVFVHNCDHPDILDFIKCKHDGKSFNNFNTSVAITDEFMEALERGTTYKIINPRTKQVETELDAKTVFEMIATEAWTTGDPGIIFIDRINNTALAPLGEIEATNPCGEQPLLPFESCNLASINLTRFIMDDGKINFGHLQSTVETIVDFLDSVIDVNVFPTRTIKDTTMRTRKIGIGIMGWADALIKMGIPYESQGAVKLACTVMETIKTRAIIRSEELANQYDAFELYDADKLMINKRRNATLTTIAPTGTISMIAGCSSGIEPLFALAYRKMNVLDGAEFEYFNQDLVEHLDRVKWIERPELKQKIIEAGYLPMLPDGGDTYRKIRSIFKTSHEIDPEWHINMQAAFQAYTCNSVSKTINMTRDSTVEDVINAYRTAYNAGCKGITIYRDKSREEQVLEKGIEIKKPDTEDTHEPQVRPQALSGLTQKVETSCGTMYVTINWNGNGKPFEVFTRVGKAGGCASSQSEAMGRMVSLALRSGVHPSHIVKQLRGISCHLPRGMGNNKVLSCADGVAQVLESVFMKEHPVQQTPIRGACPECQGPIEQQGGCSTCRNCGYSDCS